MVLKQLERNLVRSLEHRASRLARGRRRPGRPLGQAGEHGGPG